MSTRTLSLKPFQIISRWQSALTGAQTTDIEISAALDIARRTDSLVDMCIYLSSQLQAAKAAYERHQTVFGRLLNRLLNVQHAANIWVGRDEIAGILTLTNTTIAFVALSDDRCAIPFASASELLNQMNEQMAVKPINRAQVSTTTPRCWGAASELDSATV